jgi:hypothetical protein
VDYLQINLILLSKNKTRPVLKQNVFILAFFIKQLQMIYMKKLKILGSLILLVCNHFVYSQSDCEKEKQDLAQIVSGQYNCEINTIEYGGTGDFIKSSGTVTITKIGENKIKVSCGSNSFTINSLSTEGNTVILGDEPSSDNNGTKAIHLSIYEKPALISGRSSNGTSEAEKKSWNFEGVSSDNNKPESLSDEPACREIYLSPGVEFGGKVIKKRDFALCIIGKANAATGTLAVKQAADEQQFSNVLVLETPFPEDEAWKNNAYEVQTKRYWEETNKPFIDEAIALNAEIRWINDPRLDKNKYAEKPQGAQFNTTKDGKNITKVLSYTHFEYQYLLSKGYVLDSTTGLMKK